MKTNNVSFPYPVLGIADDILPGLPTDNLTVAECEDAVNYYFDVILKYENADIQKLVADGFAKYTCEVDCVKTLIRESFDFDKPSFRITIPRKSVNGRIEFHFYISVIKPIKQYTNKGFNPDYHGYSFDLDKGDILAVFDSIPYDVDIRYDKLQAAGSFMLVTEAIGQEQTRFNLATDKIHIELPTPLFEIYKRGLGDKYKEIMHSSLVYNALTCALYELNEYKTNTLWGRTLMYRLHHEDDLIPYLEEDEKGNVYIENVPALAMTILHDPYSRMFNYLNEKSETEE